MERNGEASVLLSGVIAAVAMISFGLVLHGSNPGYLSIDGFWQLTQIIEGKFEDWHSPFMTFVWSLLHAILPGPFGVVVFDNLLIWGALALTAIGVARTVGAWAILVLLTPWLPGLFNYLGHVHKDAMLVAWMLAAFACAFWGNDPATPPRVRLVWQVLANLFALAAFLTRANVIFGLVPLLLYANLPLGRRHSLFAGLLMLCLMPGLQAIQNRVLEVEAKHPGDSIKAFHLLALSYFENRNLFPGRWTASDSRTIVETCYSPVQWDTASKWGQCAGLFNSLERQEVWGSGQMTEAWLQSLLANPLGAYSAMAVTFRLSMHEPNSRAMLFEQPKSAQIQYDFPSQLPATAQLARAYIESAFNDTYGRPWVFALVSFCAAVVVFCLRLGRSHLGLFALSLIASGTIYLLTYFPLNVSAEYRYFYWSGYAAYLGLLFTLLAWLARRRQGGAQADAALPLPNSVRLIGCALLALMIALVFGSAKLPLERRTVRLVPMGDGAVAVTQLSTASVPLWMGVRHEGQIDAPGWQLRDGPVWHAEAGAAPLVAQIETLHQAIRVRLATGLDGGRVQVEDGHFSQVVDTRALEPGEVVLDLSPHGRLAERPRHVSWHAPARALFWTVVLTVFLFSLGRERRS